MAGVSKGRYVRQLHENKVAYRCVVGFWGCGIPGFEGSSIIIVDAPGVTFDDVEPVAVASGVCSLVGDDNNCTLANFPLSMNDELCASLHIGFMAIQT